MEQFEAKTGAFSTFIRKTNSKTFRAGGFLKCLESKSVLFRTFVAFRRNKVVLRCADVNANLFFRLFNLFILGMSNKALNVCSLGKQLVLFSLESRCFPRLRLGKHRDSRENKTNCFPRDQTLSV